MKLIAELKDDQYEYQEVTHTREIVRAVLLNHENKLAVLRLHGHDFFGSRNYYELPGGGVNPNENLITAIKRELEEEVGYTSTFIAEIGQVNDFYNLIKRENHTFFFLMRTDKKIECHWEEREKELIAEIVWLSIDEAIEKFMNHEDVGLPKLVKQRELPVLCLAKEILSK